MGKVKEWAMALEEEKYDKGSSISDIRNFLKNTEPSGYRDRLSEVFNHIIDRLDIIEVSLSRMEDNLLKKLPEPNPFNFEI